MGKRSPGSNENAKRVVTAAFAATGQSSTAAANPSFTQADQFLPAVGDDNLPCFYGTFNVSVFGTFVGTVTIERSFDGGATWMGVSASTGGALLSHVTPASYQLTEPERDVRYRFNCTAYTSGTINCRMSQ